MSPSLHHILPWPEKYQVIQWKPPSPFASLASTTNKNRINNELGCVHFYGGFFITVPLLTPPYFVFFSFSSTFVPRRLPAMQKHPRSFIAHQAGQRSHRCDAQRRGNRRRFQEADGDAAVLCSRACLICRLISMDASRRVQTPIDRFRSTPSPFSRRPTTVRRRERCSRFFLRRSSLTLRHARLVV